MGNVTFTETKPGTSDPETGLFTSPTSSTVVGEMVEVKPAAPWSYRPGSLIPEITLKGLFTPDTYGESPALGSTVVWPPTGGDTFSVRSVQRLAPDGTVIKSDVVISR